MKIKTQDPRGAALEYAQLLSAALTLLSAALLALGLALAVGDDASTTSEQELHCEMVQIWNETGGEYGWPDYNNTAHNCNPATNNQ